jgi:dihydropteroate synthase
MPAEHENLKLRMEWRGRTIDFSTRTFIMGIHNVSPDSFSDGGKFFDTERAVEHALMMQEEGADIIDIGGESSRPGATPVPVEQELSRVIPVVKALAKKVNVIISIDTMKAKVAEAALAVGAEMINDISALRGDTEMAPLLAKEKVPVVLMHMGGTSPQNMQTSIAYYDLISDIFKFLTDRIFFCSLCRD